MTTKTETIREYLVRLTTTNQSNESDDAAMANLLRKLGFPHAVCTCGIAYLEGKGTADAPPCSIVSVARMILSKV